MPSHRRLDNHYIIMQIGYWAMFAAFCGYQTALLLSRGFSNSQAGMIIAVRCLAGIICQPILGGFADRHPRIPLRRIVTLSLALSLVANGLFAAVPMGLAGTIAVFIVLGGFELSAYPLMDAMAVQFINVGVPIRYSLGRGIGSMSYAVVCVLMGLQVSRFGVETMLITHGVFILLEIFLVGTYPVYRGGVELKQREDQRPHSVPQLLRLNPAFALMLAGVLPLSNFLVNVVEAKGGSAAQLGIALFLMGASELPTAFFFDRLRRRLGSGRTLMLSFAGMGLKVIGCLLAPSLIWVFGAQLFQVIGYGLFTPTSVYYVNESVPAADRVRGQTLMMVASNGMGGMLGSLLGGAALDLGGVPVMLTFCLVCIGLSLALSIPALWLARRGSAG